MDEEDVVCIYTEWNISQPKKKKDTMPLAALWHYHIDYNIKKSLNISEEVFQDLHNELK